MSHCAKTYWLNCPYIYSVAIETYFKSQKHQLNDAYANDEYQFIWQQWRYFIQSKVFHVIDIAVSSTSVFVSSQSFL